MDNSGFNEFKETSKPQAEKFGYLENVCERMKHGVGRVREKRAVTGHIEGKNGS
jgi:hypothetical protein